MQIEIKINAKTLTHRLESMGTSFEEEVLLKVLEQYMKTSIILADNLFL